VIRGLMLGNHAEYKKIHQYVESFRVQGANKEYIYIYIYMCVCVCVCVYIEPLMFVSVNGAL
jgi:hypothetical protein